ncbi:MAG: ribose ABC transporter permease [Ignavibacteriae bacterium]|nr:ribose ABC transporter permease [Ignavibacteriota bacterium]
MNDTTRAARLGALVSRYGIAVAFLLEVLIFVQLTPYFLTADNLLNVSLQASINAIIAAGMTFVILTAGIDLSVGSVVALAGIVAASVCKIDLPFPMNLALGIAAGTAFGAVSGFAAGGIVTRFRITPFIATLALMTVWRGLAFVWTDGRPVWELPQEFAQIGSGRLAGIPVPALIMVLVFVVSHVVLTRTRFGRYVYAVGGNEEAARLAGLSPARILTAVYAVSGTLAAVSGVLLASRMNSGQPNAGIMYELDAIAAVVVGGTSLQGGRGTMIGTIIGALLIAVLRNGLNLLNVSSYLQQVIVGVVIVLATMLDRRRN